jgi:imidazolonepropionase-like amidohydrolase
MKHIALRAACSLAFAISASPVLAHPEVPGAPQTKPIALVGGTIHPVVGPAVEKGVLLFDQGRITAVGPKVKLPEGAERVDISGKHVYPGLFNAGGDLGLIEIGAVRATRDGAETGQLNPNVKAEVAINPDSELIPVARSGGVLLSNSQPGGGVIAGTSAVLMLDGWTWEDMTLRAPTAMHIRWPRMTPIAAWWEEASAAEQNKRRDKELQAIEEAFDDASAYQIAKSAPASKQLRDARWEAMLPVLRGELPVIIEADELQQIQTATAFAARRGFKLIISGGYDAPQCAALLKENKVPVIVSGVYRLPLRRDDHYDDPYTLPERLRKAGLEYCIAADNRFAASATRNLPYHAAVAAAFGLPADEALKSITLYPAQILGVADRVGSLEAGKDATLIITDGDPLATTTGVEAAYIQGRAVDLNDRHKRLYRKYEEKQKQAEE